MILYFIGKECKNSLTLIISTTKQGGLMFKKGEKVMYPAHGIGVIDEIEQKTIVGNKRLFYVIKILENGVTVMTPVDNVDKVGLRGLSDKKEINKALKILRTEVSLSLNENWNRRQKGYFNKIKTGSSFDVAEVYRDLYLLQMEKELSFGERKMLDNARFLIVSEIAEAKGIEVKMMMIIRGLLLIMFASIGGAIGLLAGKGTEAGIAGLIIGAIISFVIIILENRLRELPAKVIIGGAVGALAGLVAANLFIYSLSSPFIGIESTLLINVLIKTLFGYLGFGIW